MHHIFYYSPDDCYIIIDFEHKRFRPWNEDITTVLVKDWMYEHDMPYTTPEEYLTKIGDGMVHIHSYEPGTDLNSTNPELFI